MSLLPRRSQRHTTVVELGFAVEAVVDEVLDDEELEVDVVVPSLLDVVVSTPVDVVVAAVDVVVAAVDDVVAAVELDVVELEDVDDVDEVTTVSMVTVGSTRAITVLSLTVVLFVAAPVLSGQVTVSAMVL